MKGIIYPNSNSSWVNPIQYVPNNGDFIIAMNENWIDPHWG